MKGKLKKSLAILMVMIMVLSMGITALAENDGLSSNSGEVEYEDPSDVENQQKTVTEAVYDGGAKEPTIVSKNYEIKYLLVETEIEINETIKGKVQVGDIIKVEYPEIEGYQVLSEQPKELVISEDEEENKVIVYYEEIDEEDVELAVYHHYYENDDKVKEKQILKGLKVGYKAYAEEYLLIRDDLKFVGSDKEYLIISANSNEINIYYNPVIIVENQPIDVISEPIMQQNSMMRMMGAPSLPNPNEPGEVFVEKTAEWVDKDNGIGKIIMEIWGNPIQKGVDVVLVLDRSGSMEGQRLTKTKTAAKAFVEELYKSNNGIESDNRIAMVTFSDSANKFPNVSSEKLLRVSDIINDKTAKQYFNDTITAITAKGGTNYDVAFTAAKEILDGRIDETRPTYIVFMSDGEPNWSGFLFWGRYLDGQDIANTLKNSGTKIYSLGLGIQGSSFNDFIKPLASEPKETYAKSISDNTDLTPIFTGIAGETKIAGTQAVVTDYVNTNYFEIINKPGGSSWYETSHGEATKTDDDEVTWNLGNNEITQTKKTLTIYIRLKDGVIETGNLETNDSAKVEYKDFNGIKKNKLFPKPTLDVGAFGQISMTYYLVNDEGKPVDNEGSLIENFANRIKLVENKLYEDPETNSSQLRYNKEFIVNPPEEIEVAGETYRYEPLSSGHSGTVAPQNVTLYPNSSRKAFNFGYKKVTKVTVTFDKNGGDTEANPKIQIVNKGAFVGTLPTPPTRIGYSFKGWNTQSDGEGTEFVATTPVNANITVYAQWEKDDNQTLPYTVKYYKDDDELEVVTGLTVPVHTPVVESVSYANKPVGYKLDPEASTNLPFTVATEESIIKVYYVKDDNQTLPYTVKYYKDDDELEVVTGLTVPVHTPVVESVSYANKPVGYKLDPEASTNLPFTVATEESIIKVYYVKDEDQWHSVTYDANGGNNPPTDSNSYLEGSEVTIMATGEMSKTGYTFIGWKYECQPQGPVPAALKLEEVEDVEELECNKVYNAGDKFKMPSYDVTLIAQWKINKYTVTFKDHNGTVLKTETVEHGKGATAPASPSRSGYTFTGWDKDFKNITNNLTVTAQYRSTSTGGGSSGGGGGGGSSRPTTPEIVVVPEEEIPADLPLLNKGDHFQYIQGYIDGTVRPEGNITRDEVAAVFYRLLDVKYRESIKTSKHNFTDVAPERWSNIHIATLAKGGIVTGYVDGTYKPGNYITRAEMATIASKFDNLSPFEKDNFSDIKGHWANKYINSAVKKGWISGYKDGTFKPDQYITRAEFVTLVNNVLERKVKKNDILPDAKQFPDLPKDKWYYEAMQEAINSHYYEKQEDGYEIWTEIYFPKLEM